ncbi:MAG: hypothetical protein JG782_447 [Anaerophaga sp.]|nr:hypothetical protein [Anaerophaga sp.]MDK2840515.1 hypothetical protein [Anaerophaga sp.]MDN5291805.1 hypothetical protein [Anaerophaga sp.]
MYVSLGSVGLFFLDSPLLQNDKGPFVILRR